ncbi:hypothetical protein MTR67_030808 [Solanum verrucosum]|uniref:Uncharacterized protein n=1 Tax=Solanum verrucosum TaxID=315347 RepID=A0AAF0U1A2_SOLVR|nr:hypothetical protein MTR67_030808 [Solanum verrucosum]
MNKYTSLCNVVDISNGEINLQRRGMKNIRELLLEHPFYCEDSLWAFDKPSFPQFAFMLSDTHEWRPNISCDDTPDISQHESKLWAFDKPGIPQFVFMLSYVRCIIT